MTSQSLSYTVKASRSLADETFDPFAYFGLLSDPDVTAYERAVLSWAEPRVREKACEIMRKAYLTCEVRWAARWVGLTDTEAEEWHVRKGLKVDSGRLILR